MQEAPPGNAGADERTSSSLSLYSERIGKTLSPYSAAALVAIGGCVVLKAASPSQELYTALAFRVVIHDPAYTSD